MRSVNKVILIGNLTRKPELKTTTSGQSIVTFGLATNRQWTTSSGEKRNSAEFHECVAWAKLAEICSQYLKKGMLIYVEGYLKTRSWDTEDGTRRFRTEVVLQDMIILEKRSDRDDADYIPSGDEVAYDDDAAEAEEAASAEEAAPAEEAASAEEAAPAKEAAPAEEAAPAKEAAPVEAEAPAAPEAPAADNSELKADIDDDNMF